MGEDKKLFVEKLGSLIKRQTREGKTIKSIYYAVSLTTEYVIIEHWLGTEQKVDIAADNCLGIMHDILTLLEIKDTKVCYCEICGAEFVVSKYSPAKFCPNCRKKAYINTYQKPKERKT